MFSYLIRKNTLFFLNPNSLIIFSFLVTALIVNGNSQEHSFGINIGYTRQQLEFSEPDDKLFSHGIQYMYCTPKNITVGLKYIQGYSKHTYFFFVLDPVIGYRFTIADKIYPEVGFGSGLVVVNYEGIPNFWCNSGGKAGITMPITKWLNVGFNYCLLYAYGWSDWHYCGTIDQFAFEFTIALRPRP